MTRTLLRTTKGAMLSVAVLLTLAFMNTPASAQWIPTHHNVWEANQMFDVLGANRPKQGLATKKPTAKPKGFVVTKRRQPVACDCTNCSAEHCNVDFYEAVIARTAVPNGR
jgi:hypothetical protein